MGGGGSSTTVQSSAPWTAQQDYDVLNFQNALQNYQNAQAGQNMQYYPGDTYSGLNDTQQWLNSNIAQTDGTGSWITNVAADSLKPTENGQALAASNPGSGMLSSLVSSINPSSYAPTQSVNSYANGDYVTAGNPYTTAENANIAAQVLPQINSNFAAAGRMDSGLASAAQSQGLANAIGGLDYSNYTTEQGLQQQAQAMQQNAQGLQLQATGQQLAGAGQLGTLYSNDIGNSIRANAVAPLLDSAYQTDMSNAYGAATNTQNAAQNQLNANIAAYNYNQALPWNELGMYDQAIAGQLGSQGTTTSPNNVNGTANTLAGITGGLSGLNTLNGLASGSNGLFSANGLFGSAGLIGGLFSGGAADLTGAATSALGGSGIADAALLGAALI